jgi:hypothetical protein
VPLTDAINRNVMGRARKKNNAARRLHPHVG